MARDLTMMELLGILFASKNITLEDATLISEFAHHVSVQSREPALSLESAIDMALNFVSDDPNIDAQRTADLAQASHDAETCPDCGGPVDDMDDLDYEHAFQLFYTIRNMMAKTYFEIEEC